MMGIHFYPSASTQLWLSGLADQQVFPAWNWTVGLSSRALARWTGSWFPEPERGLGYHARGMFLLALPVPMVLGSESAGERGPQAIGLIDPHSATPVLSKLASGLPCVRNHVDSMGAESLLPSLHSPAFSSQTQSGWRLIFCGFSLFSSISRA